MSPLELQTVRPVDCSQTVVTRMFLPSSKTMIRPVIVRPPVLATWRDDRSWRAIRCLSEGTGVGFDTLTETAISKCTQKLNTYVYFLCLFTFILSMMF